MTIGGTDLHVPLAGHRPDALPAGSDEEALVMLSDMTPAQPECAGLNGQVQPDELITDHYVLAEAMQLYKTFGHAMRARALKVIVTAE